MHLHVMIAHLISSSDKKKHNYLRHYFRDFSIVFFEARSEYNPVAQNHI